MPMLWRNMPTPSWQHVSLKSWHRPSKPHSAKTQVSLHQHYNQIMCHRTVYCMLKFNPIAAKRRHFWKKLKSTLCVGDAICAGMKVITGKDHAMAQAVSYWPFTTGACVSPCGICGEQSGTGTSYLQGLQFSPINLISWWLSILVYHLGKNNRPVGGRSSEI
jgi:hypothetical protein